jgi:hypothetical protein
MSDLLMLALIVAGCAATVYAPLCDGLVRRPTGNAETEN